MPQRSFTFDNRNNFSRSNAANAAFGGFQRQAVNPLQKATGVLAEDLSVQKQAPLPGKFVPKGIIQRQKITGIPGIGEIDTVNYTEEELNLFKRELEEGSTAYTAIETAIALGAVKAAAGAPAVLPFSALKGLVNFLPVNIFEGDNRIPPRIGNNIGIVIKSNVAGLTPLTLTVNGNGGPNGAASVNGAESLQINSSAGFTLKGLTQTAAGNNNRLSLVLTARYQGQDLVVNRSRGFTIASKPLKWNLSAQEDINGTAMEGFAGIFYGLTVEEEWQSDSGSMADLDGVAVDERVEMQEATGIYSGIQIGVRPPTPANDAALDDHALEKDSITGPGKKVLKQTHVYKDIRTGVADVPVEDSGYRITQEVIVQSEEDKGRYIETVYRIHTTKTGAALAAQGVASGAGSGAAAGTVTYTKRSNKIPLKKDLVKKNHKDRGGKSKRGGRGGKFRSGGRGGRGVVNF